MASVYGYITLANLEAKSKIDYSTVDATAFTDANVEATITLAERMINTYLGVSTGQTVTDSIITATTLIAERMAWDEMATLGYQEEDAVKFNVYTDAVLLKYLGDHVMVTSVPMSGANHYKPDYRF